MTCVARRTFKYRTAIWRTGRNYPRRFWHRDRLRESEAALSSTLAKIERGLSRVRDAEHQFSTIS